MYTAHTVIGQKDYCIGNDHSLASLMYDIVHCQGRLVDPEPISVKENGKTIATANFGHWTADGRDVYFLFPNGAKKVTKFNLSIEEANSTTVH